MKSIAFKLWLGMMALVALVLVLLWLFQIVFLNTFYTQMRINEIRNTVMEIAALIENRQEFDKRLDMLSYNNNLTAELIDLKGDVLFSAGASGMSGQMPMMMNSSKVEAYEKVLLGETVSLQLTHPRFGSKFMLLGFPVKASGQLQGALMITLPLAPVEDTAVILKKQLVYITSILVFITLLLSYLLSRSFTKPILDITKVSMAMASGNLEARIATRHKDEIGRLAGTINNMGEELSKIDQLRKDLIANVSHELRTPLSLIKGYAETIRDVSGDSPEKRDKQIGIIIEETDRLSYIVEDILNLSQMQAGYTSMDIADFNIKDTLERVIKRFEILSEEKGIGITQANTADLMVQGDEEKIQQVLYNLISNAFNHSPKASTITVNIYEKEDRIRVEIIDKGEGIPKNELPYIWDRFYKVDKTGTRQKAGSGLGLAIVKGILNAHQSLFGAESRRGEGTVFWFELVKSHK